MNLLLLAASVTVVAGGIAAIAGRRPLVVVAGVALLLAGTPLINDPQPGLLALAARVVGAALAAEILWLGLRDEREVGGPSAFSAAALTLVATAAFVVGFGALSGGSSLGPPLSLGAALAVVTVGVAGALQSDPVRRSLGALLLVSGALLARGAIAGPTSSLEAVVAGALGVALCGAIAVVAGSRRRSPHAE